MSMGNIGVALAGTVVSSVLGNMLGKSADEASRQPTTTEKSENRVQEPWSGIIPYLIGDSPPPYWLTQTPQTTDAWSAWAQDVGQGGLGAPPLLRSEDVYPKPKESEEQQPEQEESQKQTPQTQDMRTLYNIFSAQRDWENNRDESRAVSRQNPMLGLFNEAFSPIERAERQQRRSARIGATMKPERSKIDWSTIDWSQLGS